MNATLIMAFILILIVVATVITKKLPFNFVLFIAPVLCALILGHSIEETSTFIVEQLASMMKSAGFMLLFAFLYFQMLTEAGVFDTIVSAITTKLGNKMNVIVIMVLTTLIGGFSILTGNFTPAYLITFPLMVPLYKKFDFDFDNVGECQYAVPSHWDIGKVYKRLIKQVALEKKIDVVDAIIEVYHSFISDKIDDYNSSVYYENPSYIFECFIQNKIL